jgi:hypothetical protein
MSVTREIQTLAANNGQMLQALMVWQQLNFMLNFTCDVIG